MTYFNDYKNERFHDSNLIALVVYAVSKGKSNLCAKYLLLDSPDIGSYVSGCTKRDYDVHLEFEKAIICIESKVDSYEQEYDDKYPYQTQKTFRKYSHAYPQKTYFRYLTYGASEFYIKKNESGQFSTGPFSRNFKHVPLLNIVTLIKESGALEDKQQEAIQEWYRYLTYEQSKRQQYIDMLRLIRAFRELYIGDSGLTDWPNNRVNICIPEVLLYYYSQIGQAWNTSTQRQRLGGVTVYPVGRMGKVNDAILHFHELFEQSSFTLGGQIKKKNAFYFEFNEDFNLHLKCISCAETDKKIDAIYRFIEEHRRDLSLSGKYNSIAEQYKQSTYVLYEWDLAILDNIDDVGAIISRTAEVIDQAIAVIR